MGLLTNLTIIGFVGACVLLGARLLACLFPVPSSTLGGSASRKPDFLLQPLLFLPSRPTPSDPSAGRDVQGCARGCRRAGQDSRGGRHQETARARSTGAPNTVQPAGVCTRACVCVWGGGGGEHVCVCVCLCVCVCVCVHMCMSLSVYVSASVSVHLAVRRCASMVLSNRLHGADAHSIRSNPRLPSSEHQECFSSGLACS
jgi:hypothetical protein